MLTNLLIIPILVIFNAFFCTSFCEGADYSLALTSTLPNVMVFTDLHLTEGFKAAFTALRGVAGVYAIIHITTGRTYIGSSANVGLRLMSHLVYYFE